MKNELTRYLLKDNFKSNVIISSIIAAVVCLIFSVLAICIGDAASDEKIHNIVTVVLIIWSAFVCTIGVGIMGINMSIFMNRSRKTAVKSIFLTVLLCILVCSGIALAAEGVIAGVSKATGFGYVFRPLVKSFGITDVNTDFFGIVISYLFNVLLMFTVSVASLFLITASMKFGKWLWIGWWIFYMLIMTAGKSVIMSVSRFIRGTASPGFVLLALIAVTAVVFTALDILLIKRIELKKSALMWASGVRRA